MFLAPATPMHTFMHEYSSGLAVSALAHLALLVIMSVSLISVSPRINVGTQLVIEAQLVDAGAIRRAEEKKEREARQQQQRVADERRQKAAEEQRQRDKAEQQRQAKIEQQRQAEANQQRQAQQEKERQADALRQQREAEARQKAQREAELRTAMEAEERLIAAERSGLLDQYIAVIRQKVERNWVRPANAGADLECVVHVTQIPGGEVIGVRMGNCNGDDVVVRSIEAAVNRSSPLPMPPQPELFERNLRFIFKPEQ